MFKNSNNDFKSKLEKRFDILLSKKRCSYCLSCFKHERPSLSEVIKNVSFNNKRNIYLFPFEEQDVPVSKKFVNYRGFYTIKLKQNKPKSKDYFKIIKFLILCKKCNSVTTIEAPKYFFG